MSDAQKAADRVASRSFDPSEPAVPYSPPEDDENLTPEEIAALKLGDEEGEDGAEAEDDGVLSDEPIEGDPDEQEEEEETPEEEAEEAEEEAPEPEPKQADQKEAPAADTLPDMRQYEDAVKEAQAAEEAILTDYEDGELTEDEYRQKLKEARTATFEAVRKQERASVQAEAWTNQWRSAVQSYQEEMPALFEGKVLEEFDRRVREVNADQSEFVQRMSMRDRLARAHRLLALDAEHLGLEIPDTPGKAAGKKAARPAKAADKVDAGTERVPPRTLANVPNAATVDDGSRFAALEQLRKAGDPEAFEKALDKMSEAERNAYLAS